VRASTLQRAGSKDNDPTIVVRRHVASKRITYPLQDLPPPHFPPDAMDLVDYLRLMGKMRGLSARDALHKMLRLGLTARVDGTGFVVSQDPAAGTPLDYVSSGHLTLARIASAHQDQARP